MMWWIFKQEYQIGLVISGWYVGDIIQISTKYHPKITHISSRYHPYINYTYRPNITHISHKYHRYITHISSKNHPVNFFYNPPLDEKTSFNPNMEQKTPLYYPIKTLLLIIQILPKYHPEIIQKSSSNHTEIIQKSSSWHRFLQPPTCWKVKFKARYGMTIAGENSTSERH